MPPKQDKLSQRMDHLKAALRRNGIKLTHQRMIIFQEVAESEEHPNAELVYKAVRRKLPMVSLDTRWKGSRKVRWEHETASSLHLQRMWSDV
jgi:hypothetical protein